MSGFYELQAPTHWAAPPEPWSSTTLDDVETCPRRWQLLRSRWGDHERFPIRQHPAAIEGQIVHEALDRLARACGQRGNPGFGTPGFSEAATEADFFGGFAKAVVDWQERLAHHPRPGPPFRLRTSPLELVNRAVRLFKEQYQPGAGSPAGTTKGQSPGPVDLAALVHTKGALSEVRLRHPELPFVGVLDRVFCARDGVEVVDFKTGNASDAHREQLLRYAVLWWRTTDVAPARVTVQYLDGSQTWTVDTPTLVGLEERLAARIAALTDLLATHPAPAAPGTTCRWCSVRARCAQGWALGEEAARADGRGDAELIVASTPSEHGFLARGASGAEVAVVHEASVAGLVPAVGVGQVVRVVDGVRREKGKELELKAWTEVFVVGEPDTCQ